MSKKQRRGNSSTDKERQDTKRLPKSGVIDGVGGMGGSSGAGGERARVDYVGEISGIDIKGYPGDATPGRSVHSAHGAGHTERGKAEHHPAAQQNDE